MVAEARPDQRQHLARDRIGRHPARPRHEQVGLGGLAVLGIEVPAPARRLVPVHQQPGAPAHVAIEILHAQLLAARGPGGERRGRTQEALVRQDVHRQPEARRPGLLHLPHPPFARFGDHHPLRPVPRDRRAELLRERPAIVRIVQGHIIDRPAEPPQLRREMAHGREQEGDLLPVMPHIARLVRQLRHEHAVARRIGPSEAGEGRRELVAEDEDQFADGGH